MKNLRVFFALSLTLLVMFLAGSFWGPLRAEKSAKDVPVIAYAWGSQISVYDASEKKLYVYTDLGGHCVFAYTLSSPGGLINGVGERAQLARNQALRFR